MAVPRSSFKAAIEQLERALSQLDKADPVITWHLADAYRSVSRFQDALASYERALELDPKAEDAEKIRAQIELLRLQLGQVRARERGSAP
jgi:tetratricopeptide (TPR) repeat protein